MVEVKYLFHFLIFGTEFWNFLLVLKLMLYEGDYRLDCSLPEE